MYNPDGDTVVFLAMKDGAYSNTPSFRINSSPLLHRVMDPYIRPVGDDTPPQHTSFNFEPSQRIGTPTSGVSDISSRPGSQPHSRPPSRPGPRPTAQRVVSSGSIRPQSSGSSKDWDPSSSHDGLQEVAPLYSIHYPHSAPVDDAQESLLRLLDARNLFAFLDKSFLVGSKFKRDSPFAILEYIHQYISQTILQSQDGLRVKRRSRQQETAFMLADEALSHQIAQLGLDDVRNDHERMLRVLKIAEDFQNDKLYHNVFIHCVGSWELGLKEHPMLSTISDLTRSKIERSSFALETKVQNINERLTTFEFPSIALSLQKHDRTWRRGFESMRSFTLDYVKDLYGRWPPRPYKTGKKAGPLTKTGGLNRIVLQKLYADFVSIYELCANHSKLTMETSVYEAKEPEEQDLLKLLEEFDASTPPVQPSIPFALPIVPQLPPHENPKKGFKKLSGDALQQFYEDNAYNKFTYPEDSSFLQMFKSIELRSPQSDIAGLRRGRWIFIYAVLQSLVQTACDVPGLPYTAGVEYFLSEGSRTASQPPWNTGGRPGRPLSMMWPTSTGMEEQNVGGDIDAAYANSKCWILAAQWRMELEGLANVQTLDGAADIGPPVELPSARTPTMGRGQGPELPEFAPHPYDQLGNPHTHPLPHPYSGRRVISESIQSPVSGHGRRVVSDSNYSPSSYTRDSLPPTLRPGTGSSSIREQSRDSSIDWDSSSEFRAHRPPKLQIPPTLGEATDVAAYRDSPAEQDYMGLPPIQFSPNSPFIPNAQRSATNSPETPVRPPSATGSFQAYSPQSSRASSPRNPTHTREPPIPSSLKVSQVMTPGSTVTPIMEVEDPAKENKRPIFESPKAIDENENPVEKNGVVGMAQ